MSDNQQVWCILWARAARSASPRQPFEIHEVAEEVAGSLGGSLRDALRLVGRLITELCRLPDGEQFFALEGNAIVPLPEFVAALRASRSPIDVYPYEL